MLRILSEKKQRRFYEENLGQVATVLFEQEAAHGFIQGFTGNYIRVCTPYEPSLPNTLQAVQLKCINAAGLVETAETVSAPTRSASIVSCSSFYYG